MSPFSRDFVLASDLALSERPQATPIDSRGCDDDKVSEKKTPETKRENAHFLEKSGVKALGLEPRTYGLKVRCSTD